MKVTCRRCGGPLTGDSCAVCGVEDRPGAGASTGPGSWSSTPLYRRDRRRLPLMVAALLFVGGLLLIAGWWASRQGVEAWLQRPTGPAGAPTPTQVAAPSAPRAGSATPTEATPVPKVTATVTPSPVDRPGRAAVADGSWILVLDSLPQKSVSAAEARSRPQDIQGNVTVIDSSLTPGLNPGYWAIVSAEGYPSEAAARAACADFGRRPSDDCYPRRVG